MEGVFKGCSSLVSLDLSNFDTSKVSSMYEMFSGCSQLNSLNLSNFKNTHFGNMGTMFKRCSSLISLDLSNFDTTQVNTMKNMLNGCSSLISLDLSNFNAANVGNMENIFRGCSQLVFLDISNFNTQNVNDQNTKVFYNNTLLRFINLFYYNGKDIFQDLNSTNLQIYIGKDGKIDGETHSLSNIKENCSFILISEESNVVNTLMENLMHLIQQKKNLM